MPVVVRIQHIRAQDHCIHGTRAWFKAHGLDWNVFLTEGLPAETFEATDHLGFEVAQVARREAENGQE
jgi:hypothetical protein